MRMFWKQEQRNSSFNNGQESLIPTTLEAETRVNKKSFNNLYTGIKATRFTILLNVIFNKSQTER